MKKQVPFRVALSTMMLLLVLGAVAVITVSTYLNGTSTADDLSSQILKQTAQRLEQRVDSLFHTAIIQSNVHKNLLEADSLDSENQQALTSYFYEALAANPELSFLSFTSEATGNYSHATRDEKGDLSIRHATKEQDHYWIRDYQKSGEDWELSGKAIKGHDTRERPWYAAARKAKKQSWTETYLFLGKDGEPEAPGVTLTTPVYDQNDGLQGVLTADFNFTSLSHFLKQLKIGRRGFAFLLELRADGKRRVIAHPNHRILTRQATDKSGQKIYQAVTVEQFADPRARAFATQLPDALSPTDQHVHKVEFKTAGVSFLGSYGLVRGHNGINWIIGLALPEQEVVGRIHRANRLAVLVGIIAGLIVLIVAIFFSGKFGDVINKLVAETEEIAQFRLEPKPPIESRLKEVHGLGNAFQHMKTSLRSFQKYVPADLVRELILAGKEAELGGQRCELSIYFSDIAGFTGLSEKLSSEDLVHILGEYLSSMSRTILANHGTIDKYIGDAIMAFWGAPRPCPTHPLEACKTAIQNQRELAKLRRKWQEEGFPDLQARIGIHTGEVFVGNIGSDTRLDYTVIGDAVNLASRLEGLNKRFNTEIIISEATFQQVKNDVVARPLDRVAAKGKEEGIVVYELLGLKPETDETTVRLMELCTEGVSHYFQRNWTGASQLFQEALQLKPGDTSSQLLLTRCQEYQTAPPPSDWDGVHRMTVK